MIDEKKLLEWLNDKIDECQTYASPRYFGRHESFVEVRKFIEAQRAELTNAHARIDKARKANAKPIMEDFVIPMTVDGEPQLIAEVKNYTEPPKDQSYAWDAVDYAAKQAQRKPVRCCDDEPFEWNTDLKRLHFERVFHPIGDKGGGVWSLKLKPEQPEESKD